MEIIHILVLCSAALVNLVQAGKHDAYSRHTVHGIYLRDSSDAELLHQLENRLDLDLWQHGIPGDREALVRVTPENRDAFLRALDAEEISHYVHLDNVAKALEQHDEDIARWRSSRAQRMVFEDYYRYDEIDAHMERIAAEYPNLVTLVNAGKSFEGRDIKYLKISTTNFEDPSKPIYFMNAMIHAREWVTTPVALYSVYRLVESLRDEDADLLRDVDWIILPLTNPDGYEFSFTERLWRKTRSIDLAVSNCVGIDGNRNFDVQFNTVGVSSNPCSDTYPGTYAFSEPETRYIRDILHENVDRIQLYMDIHSHGYYVLFGYGDRSLPQNAAQLHHVASAMGAAMDAMKLPQALFYRIGNSATILYPSSGSAQDYGQHVGVPFSYTLELPGYGYGFLVPPQFVDHINKETWEGIAVSARLARSYYRVRYQARTTTAVPTTHDPTNVPNTPDPTEPPTDAPNTPAPTDPPTDAPNTPAPTDPPTDAPNTPAPTDPPTDAPNTPAPTDPPTDAPNTPAPTDPPTDAPNTPAPTDPPTDAPNTPAPTDPPTDAPNTPAPTEPPTDAPNTPAPTDPPTDVPNTPAPTDPPTDAPNTPAPTEPPTDAPNTPAPTDPPTDAPNTPAPTDPPTDAPNTPAPTDPPTGAPNTPAPTDPPTDAPNTPAPTDPPTDASNTPAPTDPPTDAPNTPAPTEPPTDAPNTSAPTDPPTDAPNTPALTDPPTDAPNTPAPTDPPTDAPNTPAPTEPPTDAPNTPAPTEPPTDAPNTPAPTDPPTDAPNTPASTDPPTDAPNTPAPTDPPTDAPNTPAPTDPPTDAPTDPPTDAPNTPAPTDPPTDAPNTPAPTDPPTDAPNTPAPTDPPTDAPNTPAPTDAPADAPIIPAPADTPTNVPNVSKHAEEY